MDAEQALQDRIIAVPEARQLDVLANLLEKRGATVLRCPLVGINDNPDQGAVLAWLKRQIEDPPQLLVFYTGEGIERLLAAAARAGIENEFRTLLAAVPKLTRGPKPKRALRRLELEPQLEALEPTTRGLIATLGSLELTKQRVAVQLYAADQSTEIVEHLRARGVEVDCVAPYVYASAAEDRLVVELIDRLAGGGVDAIAFTSKAQFQRLRKLARERDLERKLNKGLAATKVAAVGPVVAAELADAGVRVDTVPDDSYSMKPLVTSLCTLLGRNGRR